MNVWDVIRIAMIRNHISSIETLAEMTGIKPATLQQTRRRDPGSFRLYELNQLDKVLEFTTEEWEGLR